MGLIKDVIYGVPPDSEATGNRCKVQWYLDTLPPEDADDFREALTAKIGDKYAAAGKRIAFAMSFAGHPISATTINEHRGRICRCYRKAAE